MLNLMLGQFSWVDWLIFGSLLLGFLYGVVKGFMREIAEILETAGLIFLVLEFQPRLIRWISPSAGQSLTPFIPLLSFVAVFAVFAFAISFVDGFLRPILKTTLLTPLRLLGGALLGAVHGLLFAALLLSGLTYVPVPRIQADLSPGHSLFGPRAMEVVPRVHHLVSQVVVFVRQMR